MLIEKKQIELTEREREIATACCKGQRAKDIAQELGISKRTVDAHKANIYHKLGISNCVQLMQVIGMY